MYIKILSPGTNAPEGKVAEAELHFLDPVDGELRGLKLCGFSVWTRRTGDGFNVTMPARTYQARNGESRTFTLLRGIEQEQRGQALIDTIVAAYEDWRKEQPRTSPAAHDRETAKTARRSQRVR